MKVLILDGKVEAHGKTRDRYYALKPIVDHAVDLDITPSLEEDQVGRKHIYPHLTNFPRDTVEICEYGFSQMMSNVIDHSRGDHCRIRITTTAQNVSLGIRDDGVGIFYKIKDQFGFENQRDSILELSKGKLTTDPDHHTGEGIFFTSRLFDKVIIASDGVRLRRKGPESSWEITESDSPAGTAVRLSISTSSPPSRTISDVFNRFSTDGHAHMFNRTEVPLILARFNSETLMSRSQARRVLRGLNAFEEVCLDFKGVPSIGQPFADEIFRIYRTEHEHVELNWMNANLDIEGMISRVSDHQ